MSELEDTTQALIQRIEAIMAAKMAELKVPAKTMPASEEEALEFVNRYLVPQGIRAAEVKYDRAARSIHIVSWKIEGHVEKISVNVRI